MQITLGTAFNEEPYSLRKETYGPDGEMRELTVRQKHFHFAHHFYNLGTTSALHLRFDRPTFIFCLGDPAKISYGDWTTETGAKNMLLFFIPNAQATISLKTFKTYQFFFLSCDKGLLKRHRKNVQTFDAFEEAIVAGIAQSQQVNIPPECESIIQTILETKMSGIASTSLLRQVIELASLSLDEIQQGPLEKDDSKIVTDAKDYLQNNLEQYTTEAEYCKKAGLVNNRLQNLFKETFSVTANEFIQSKRVEKAKALLNEHHQMRFISKCIGCSSSSQFSIFFSKHTGESPTEYKKRKNRSENGVGHIS